MKTYFLVVHHKEFINLIWPWEFSYIKQKEHINSHPNINNINVYLEEKWLKMFLKDFHILYTLVRNQDIFEND